MSELQSDEEYVLRTVESRGIHFIQFWFTDVLGNLKHFAATPGELEDALIEGMGFDGSSVEGFSSLEESDCVAFPDPETFQILPWRPKEQGAARMFCDIKTPDGKVYEGDPRAALRRVCDRAQDMGYILNVGPTIENFYFKDDTHPTPMDRNGYFDILPLAEGDDLRRETVLTLEKAGVPVQYSHHEAAPSQHEMDLRYSDALSMADELITYRLAVKEVARRNNCYASFMPKPIASEDGSGMHLHLSLFDLDGNDLFHDTSDESGNELSVVAKQFLAGLLKYAREYTLLTNQYVNSYKRLVRGSDAPIFVTWAKSNRSALVRVPYFKPGKSLSSRLDLRSPDPACNPYLALAGVFAAGLAGIEEGLELPPAQMENLNELSDEELAARHIQTLPQDLQEATDEFERSELMRRTLGDHIFDFLVRTKRQEWTEYMRSVSSWELERYYAYL
ncbi:glutamine synthetase [bacterium]|nr:glutamine synthetase [bacterium]